jgi:hypothetical protein
MRYEFPAAEVDRPESPYPKAFVIDFVRGHRLRG